MPATQPLVHLVEADTCPQAWLQAAEFLQSNHGAAYNLVLAVRSPAILTAADFAVYDIVDGFLREYDRAPLTTVASTIFPANFYLHGGAEELYNTFPQVYAHVRDLSAIYAIRMLRKPANGKGAGPAQINPLQIIVEKIKKQSGDGRMRAVYEANLVEEGDFLELPIYDALCDAHRARFQPCLTHLSFKLLPEEHVMLTVLYRYHYYIEKALGNLLGLAQLLYFVARETGLGVGPLVCHSTFGVLDTEGGWGARAAKRLIAKCRRAQGGGRRDFCG